MRRTVLSCTLLALLCAPPLARAQEAVKLDQASEQAKAHEQFAFSLGVLAYIYGFPLVRMEQIRQQALAQAGVGVNQFRHRRRLATPQDRTVVSPNNDTVYSSAWLDLAREPLILHMPAANGRYCSYAFYDAYTNNFKVISKRTNRDAAADYAITGPQWKGALPKGVVRIEAPTNSVWLLVRTLIVDENDWLGVQALQERMKLVPLSAWGNPATAAKPPTAANDQMPATRGTLDFFEQMGALLRRNQPPASEAVLLDQFAAIGLSVKDGFDADRLNAATRTGLLRAIPAARQIITTMKGDQTLRRVNGWLLATKGGEFGDDYLFRAIIAEKGIGQLVPEEASYLVTDVDGDGQPLNGAHKYILHFPKGQLPPAHEFWSLTLYAADFFFIENPINRYALGDRTRGLKYAADGGLTIYLQHEAPSGNEANWLPAPRGDFNLSLRAYLPKAELLNNSYTPPAVQRVK
jgi:hypothetical protein